MNKNSAAIKVFSIWELFEPILLLLDMRTLLLAQRVCRIWRETIRESQPVQRALYFEVDETPYCRHQGSPIYRQNPLAEEIVWPIMLAYAESGRTVITDGFRKLTQKTASWRRMLFTQPPDPTIGICFISMDDGNVELLRWGWETKLTPGPLYLNAIEFLVMDASFHPSRETCVFFDEGLMNRYPSRDKPSKAMLPSNHPSNCFLVLFGPPAHDIRPGLSPQYPGQGGLFDLLRELDGPGNGAASGIISLSFMARGWSLH